jgi:hypothetical protein
MANRYDIHHERNINLNSGLTSAIQFKIVRVKMLPMRITLGLPLLWKNRL